MAKKKTETAEGAEQKAEETVTAPKMPEQNGVRRPKPGTATGRVWEIADELSESAGKPASRADVLKTFTAEGGNPSTGATQYGRWRKFHGLGRYSKETEEPQTADTAAVEE